MLIHSTGKDSRPHLHFEDTDLMTSRTTRRFAVEATRTHTVIVMTTMGDARAYHLTEWLAAEAEMICFMLRLRTTTTRG